MQCYQPSLLLQSFELYEQEKLRNVTLLDEDLEFLLISDFSFFHTDETMDRHNYIHRGNNL